MFLHVPDLCQPIAGFLILRISLHLFQVIKTYRANYNSLLCNFHQYDQSKDKLCQSPNRLKEKVQSRNGKVGDTNSTYRHEAELLFDEFNFKLN